MGTKITALSENTALASGDLLVTVDDPSGTPLSQKITINNLLKALTVLTALTNPDDTTDELLIYDTSAGAAKKITVAELLESILTTNGDILYRNSSGVITRLAIGSSGKVLTVSGGLPAWASGGQTQKSLPAEAWSATNDAASFASAQLQVKQSSAAVPSPRWHEWLFDASTDEFIVCHFSVPSNYGSAPQLRIRYKMTSATSGAVGWGVRVMCLTPDDASDMDAETFATSNTGSETVPGTAGHLGEITISMTNNDSMAAADECVLLLYRDADGSEVTDSATGDAEFVGAVFEWTAA